jgi:hypothetical protein
LHPPAPTIGPGTGADFKPPSPPQHKVDHDDNNENLVANVGSEDSYNSRKQQNNNGAQNENCGFHVEPPSFDQRLKVLCVSRQPFSASSITCRSTRQRPRAG